MIYVCYALADLCSLISDNGLLLEVQQLLPASSWSMLLYVQHLSWDAFGLKHLKHHETELLKQSSLKCFKRKREIDEGPSQLLLCCLAALIHFILRVSSFRNECKVHPFPLVVLHPAAMQSLGLGNHYWSQWNVRVSAMVVTCTIAIICKYASTLHDVFMMLLPYVKLQANH